MSMAIRNKLALALLLPGVLLAVPAGAVEPWFKLPDTVARRPASLDPDILKEQVLLDRERARTSSMRGMRSRRKLG